MKICFNEGLKNRWIPFVLFINCGGLKFYLSTFLLIPWYGKMDERDDDKKYLYIRPIRLFTIYKI